MSAIYLFRLDDISWDMNYENFCRIRDLFHKYDICPLLGIIPDNEDKKLKSQMGIQHISKDLFWSEMRELQQNHGWDIALHGYNHVYVTDDCGLFGINHFSEFAGLTLLQQEEKIQKGKLILESHGIAFDSFMAPGHSMDWNTVEALKQNDIFVVTDGCSLYPYRKRGVLFIPQQYCWPIEKKRGIFTICLHVNLWDDKQFEELEMFLQEHKKSVLSFQLVIDSNCVHPFSITLYSTLWSAWFRINRMLRPYGSKVKHWLLR